LKNPQKLINGLEKNDQLYFMNIGGENYLENM